MNPQFTGNASDSFARPHLFFFSLSFRSTCIFSSRLKYMKKYFSTGSVAMEKKRRIGDIYGYSIRFSFDANAEREREREGRSRVEME